MITYFIKTWIYGYFSFLLISLLIPNEKSYLHLYKNIIYMDTQIKKKNLLKKNKTILINTKIHINFLEKINHLHNEDILVIFPRFKYFLYYISFKDFFKKNNKVKFLAGNNSFKLFKSIKNYHLTIFEIIRYFSSKIFK